MLNPDAWMPIKLSGSSDSFWCIMLNVKRCSTKWLISYAIFYGKSWIKQKLGRNSKFIDQITSYVYIRFGCLCKFKHTHIRQVFQTLLNLVHIRKQVVGNYHWFLYRIAISYMYSNTWYWAKKQLVTMESRNWFVQIA